MRAERVRDPERLLHGFLLTGIAILFLALSIQEIRSLDFWWQLRTGQWIVQNRALPEKDAFTYTVPGHEWIEVRWLFFVLTYLGWMLGGPALLILAQTTILGVALLVIAWPERRVVTTAPGALVLILAIWAASGRFIVRPEIITFLMVAVELALLDLFRRGRCRRLVWTLPVLQILWNNSHTLFALGPALAWLFVLGDLAGRLMPRIFRMSRSRRGQGARSHGEAGKGDAARLAMVAAAVTAAAFVNAYGLRGVTFPFLLFKEMHAGSILGRTVEELRSPFSMSPWTWDLWAAAALTVLTAMTFLLRRERIDLARLAVWGAVVYLAGQSMRNVALLGFVSAWAALRNLDEASVPSRSSTKGVGGGPSRVGQENRPRGFFPFSTRVDRGARLALLALTLLGAWYVASNRYAARFDQNRIFGLGIVDGEQADEACAFLLREGASPQVFHAMADGSYLDWAAHERFPVFIDGRNEVFGEPFIAEYLSVVSGARDWDSFADHWRIGTAMLHRDETAGLIEVLRQSPQWVPVHVDAREIVFVRGEYPQHASLIRRYRIDPKAPWSARSPEPEETPSGWRRWIGSVGRPWHSLGMAKSLLSLGAVDPAAAYLERALKRFPDHREVRLTLAQVYVLRGRRAEASRLLEGLSVSREETNRMDDLLATLDMMEGRPAQALEPLERLVAARPDDGVLLGRLARACLEAREHPRAVEAYRRALARVPTNGVLWMELGHACALSNDVDCALKSYENALRYRPSLYAAHYNTGILLARRGEVAAAADRFRQALRIKPDYEPARRALGHLSETVPLSETAASIDPGMTPR